MSIKMLIENEMALEENHGNLQDLIELGGSAQKVHSLLMETMLVMAKSINSHVSHMKGFSQNGRACARKSSCYKHGDIRARTNR